MARHGVKVVSIDLSKKKTQDTTARTTLYI